MPYRPKHAILTGQSLTLQSTSTDVMGPTASTPKEASVHTNGDLTVIGQPTVTGTGELLGLGDGQLHELQGRHGHQEEGLQDPPGQRPGVLHQGTQGGRGGDADAGPTCARTGRPGATRAATGPCTACTRDWATSPYKGWSFKSGTQHLDGVQGHRQRNLLRPPGRCGQRYRQRLDPQHHGDRVRDGAPGCTDKQYGNIVWDHYDTPAPAFTNLFFMADGDLSATSNFYSGPERPGKRGLRDVRRGGGDPGVDQLERAGRGRSWPPTSARATRARWRATRSRARS